MPAPFPDPSLAASSAHRFRAGLAHAVRTPLTGLLTHLELGLGVLPEQASAAEAAALGLDAALEAAAGEPTAPGRAALAARGADLLAAALRAVEEALGGAEAAGLAELRDLEAQLRVLAGAPGEPGQALRWLTAAWTRRGGTVSAAGPGRWLAAGGGVPAGLPPVLDGSEPFAGSGDPGEIAPSWSFPLAAIALSAARASGSLFWTGSALVLTLPEASA